MSSWMFCWTGNPTERQAPRFGLRLKVAARFLAAHAITTIHYLVQRELGAASTKQLMALILRVFRVAAMDSAVIEQALRLALADFEDAVTAAAALTSGCEFVVTRDPKGRCRF